MDELVRKRAVLVADLREALDYGAHVLRWRRSYDPNSWAPLDALHERVRALYRDWTPPPPLANDTVEIFAPVLFRFNKLTEFNRNYPAWAETVLHLCLYVDRIWLPDPAEAIMSSIGTHSIEGCSKGIHDCLDYQVCKDMLRWLEQLQPLADAGVIAFYPSERWYTKSVARKLFGAPRGFTEDELRNCWPDLYVAEGLLFASSLGASYASLLPEEFHALATGAAQASDALGALDAKIVAALPRTQLPFFPGLNATEMVRARSDDAALADFRAMLRDFGRAITAGIGDHDFSKEVRRLEKDQLEPAITNLVDSLRRVKVLRKRLTEGGIDFAAAGLAAAAATQDAASSLALGALSAVCKALIQTALQRKARPASRLAYRFSMERPALRPRPGRVWDFV